MSFRMWKSGNKTNDYKLFDRVVGEQYNIGGVDAWLYTYEGPKGNEGSTDSTLPDYSVVNPTLSSLGDYVFGETVHRSYNTQAITLAVAYQIQEATPDQKLPGLFFNFETMDITVHYNTMMERVGRKIIAGDVLELPNLRDTDVIGTDTGINRFYVVQDSFKASEGYSATWHHHIWKLRVKPLTDSPEFSDLLGDNGFLNNPLDPNNPTGTDSTYTPGSNAGAEMDIMNRILTQADAEVPYIHFDKEHIYDDSSTNSTSLNDMLTGYVFPVNVKAFTFFNKMYTPVLYEKTDSGYTEVPSSTDTVFPSTPEDGQFAFLKNEKSFESIYVLYQYYKDENRWVMCEVQYKEEVDDSFTDDYYVQVKEPEIFQLQSDAKTWQKANLSDPMQTFTSSDIAWNPHHPHDQREGIPPARGDVPEGTQFPSEPEDGQYFYRTDYNPVTLWKYTADSKKWTMFNYGGRLPWTGGNLEMTDFINTPDKVSIKDVVLPNIKYRK